MRNNEITKRKLGIGLSAIYIVGATILTYYTWPFGFIFLGPTMGIAAHYAYSIRNNVNSAYPKSYVEVAVQTDPPMDIVENIRILPPISAASIHNVITYHFKSKTCTPPGGPNPNVIDIKIEEKRNSIYEPA